MFGYLTGFLNQIGRVVGLIVAVYGSIHLHLPMKNWMDGFVDPPFSGLLSYIFLFIAIYLASLLVVNLLDRVLHAAELKNEDRKLGALLGMVKGTLISAVLLFGFALYPGVTVAHDIESSYTGRPLLLLTRAMVVRIPDSLRQRIENTLERVHDVSESSSEPVPSGGPDEETSSPNH